MKRFGTMQPLVSSAIDTVLVQWGDRLFYPGNRMVKQESTPRLGLHQRAEEVRRRIEAVVRHVPQAFLHVTCGGRGMGAIAVHLRYISKDGKLAVEDDRGVVQQDKDELHDLVEQWRLGGSLINESSERCEALYLTLSMPRGTDAQIVLRAAREFAHEELTDHRYVMVLHEHQQNPHVHLCVRIESMDGRRLQTGRAVLYRWRETFAQKLRGLGVEADATRQSTRAAGRFCEEIWQCRARDTQGLRKQTAEMKSGLLYERSRAQALKAWAHLVAALRGSDQERDRELARQISGFIQESDFAKQHGRESVRQIPLREVARDLAPAVSRTQADPRIER